MFFSLTGEANTPLHVEFLCLVNQIVLVKRRNDLLGYQNPTHFCWFLAIRMIQTATKITQGEELSMTAETPSKDSKDLNAKTPSKNITKGVVRSKAHSGSKSSSKGRRNVTIPKEPNFHTSNIPKRCVKNTA